MMEKSALNENTTKKYTSNDYFYWKTVGFSLILKKGCDNYQWIHGNADEADGYCDDENSKGQLHESKVGSAITTPTDTSGDDHGIELTFTSPPTKLREGTVFSRVCLSMILSTGRKGPLPTIHWTSVYITPSPDPISPPPTPTWDLTLHGPLLVTTGVQDWRPVQTC